MLARMILYDMMKIPYQQNNIHMIGIKAAGIDVRLCDIGEQIQETMESYECKPCQTISRSYSIYNQSSRLPIFPSSSYLNSASTNTCNNDDNIYIYISIPFICLR